MLLFRVAIPTTLSGDVTMGDRHWFGLLRLFLLALVLAGMLSLATPDQRSGLFIIGGTVALFVSYIGLRWLIAWMFGRRLALLRIWEIK